MFRTVHDDDCKPMFKQVTIDIFNEYSADNNFETEASRKLSRLMI